MASPTLVLLVAAYCLCSSLMLIVNKMAVQRFPYPSIMLLLQASTTSGFILGLHQCGVVALHPFQPSKMRHFAVLVAGFVAALYTNINALKYVTVDTVICARAAMPLVMAPLEFCFFGRGLPSARSWGSLCGVLLGSMIFAGSGSLSVSTAGMAWLAVWFVVSLSQIMWLKHTVEASKGMSTWDRSLYQNALSLPVFACMALVSRETAAAHIVNTTTAADWGVVAASCLVGVGISYFGFALASAVSATLFATIGNMCKVLTILIGFVVGPDHASPVGVAGLLVSIAAGALYVEPPVRAGQEARVRAGTHDEESALLASGDKEDGKQTLGGDDEDAPHAVKMG